MNIHKQIECYHESKYFFFSNIQYHDVFLFFGTALDFDTEINFYK